MERHTPLRRGGPLQRRTPLTARTGLDRDAWAPARAPVRQVSAKRAAQNRQRRDVVAVLAAAVEPSDRCPAAVAFPEVPCGGPVDPHEPLTRSRGGSITDPANIRLICRNHHDYVHLHPAEGDAAGWLMPSSTRSRAVPVDP